MTMVNQCMVDKCEMNLLLYQMDMSHNHLYVHYPNLVDHNSNLDISVRVYGQYCYDSKNTKPNPLTNNAYFTKTFYILLYYITIDLTHIKKILVIISHYSMSECAKIVYNYVLPKIININNDIKINKYNMR